MIEQKFNFKREQTQRIYEKIINSNQICECGFLWTLKDILKLHHNDESGHYWWCGGCEVIISAEGDKTFYLGEAFEEIYAKLREKVKIEKIQSKNRTLDSSFQTCIFTLNCKNPSSHISCVNCEQFRAKTSRVDKK